MRPDAQCRSCKAPVRWVLTAANGKRMPIDPEPVEDGNVWISHVEDGTPVVQVGLSHDDVPRSEAFAYVSHFTTCPQSREWRKK